MTGVGVDVAFFMLLLMAYDSYSISNIFLFSKKQKQNTYAMQIMTSNLNMMIIVIIILKGFFPSHSHRYSKSDNINIYKRTLVKNKKKFFFSYNCHVKLHLYNTIIIILAHHTQKQMHVKKSFMKIACGHSS